MHYAPPSDAGRAGGDRSRIPPIVLFYLLATLLGWVLPQTKPALHRHQSQTAPVNKGASHNLLFTFLFSCCGWGWRSGGEEPAVMLVQHLGLNWGYWRCYQWTRGMAIPWELLRMHAFKPHPGPIDSESAFEQDPQVILRRIKVYALHSLDPE